MAEPLTPARPAWLRDRQRGASLTRPERMWGVVFTLPAAIYFAVFWIYPLILSGYYSFTNYDLFQSPQWVGTQNYRDLFADPTFQNSLKVTALFAVGSIVPTIALSLVLAVPLSHQRPSSMLFRALFFIPLVMPMVAAALLWQAIYTTDGLANTILQWVGITRVDWLTDSRVALWALVIMVVWKHLGLYLILFVAGIQTIPPTVYEAAALDGARTLRTFFLVTLPLLRRTLLFVVVIAIVGAMQAFAPAFILTRGGPANATQLLPLYLYTNAFSFTRMGYASAIAVLLFVGLVMLSLAQFQVFRRGENA